MTVTARLALLLPILFVATTGLVGCISSIMKYEKSEQMNSIDEFDQKVKIDPLKSAPVVTAAAPVVVMAPAEPKPAPHSKKKSKKKNKAPDPVQAPVSTVHQPAEVEGTEGFVGRRPVKDPFRVGEKVTHEVTYFGILAGNMILSVEPYTLVNGRKSYEFTMRALTRSVFNAMYAADDSATNLVDYETLIPTAFFLHIKESKQLEEARGLFDHEKGTATYWQRRKTPNDPEEIKKKEWMTLDFSQNVFSAAFYMRTFSWKEGDEHAFRVTDNAENLIFKAKALRKEKLKTAAGTFDTIVVKPEVQLQGVAKPVGDLFIWLSDDDRKYILRIEAKIRIGTFVSEVVEIDPGLDPQNTDQKPVPPPVTN